jgi:anti-sigma factor RsiW
MLMWTDDYKARAAAKGTFPDLSPPSSRERPSLLPVWATDRREPAPSPAWLGGLMLWAAFVFGFLLGLVI